MAMMDSSASLKLSMRWECWILSVVFFFFEDVKEFFFILRVDFGVRDLDMARFRKKYSFEYAGFFWGFVSLVLGTM